MKNWSKRTVLASGIVLVLLVGVLFASPHKWWSDGNKAGLTATITELNALDGITSTVSELNILDGVTATATEINTLDGVAATLTYGELNILDGVTSTAAEINKLDGATVTVAEINLNDGMAGSIGFAIAAGNAANECEITSTVQDAAGSAITATFMVNLWLSDATTGAGLAADSFSGDVVTTNGVEISEFSSKKAFLVQTTASGTHKLSITDTSSNAFYLCGQVPGTGATNCSRITAAADYN